MITDPTKWVDDYKIGNTYRVSSGNYNNSNFQKNDIGTAAATQVYLMGDGSMDSYSNGIRNEIFTTEQNYSKLQFNSMASNDIETININGLT